MACGLPLFLRQSDTRMAGSREGGLPHVCAVKNTAPARIVVGLSFLSTRATGHTLPALHPFRLDPLHPTPPTADHLPGGPRHSYQVG